MELTLAYGKKGLNISVPNNLKVDVVEPDWVEGCKDPEAMLLDALRNPTDSESLSICAGSAETVGIVFSDITRATPYQWILPAILEELGDFPDERITFFCATGTHRAATQAELVSILGEEIPKRFRIVQNTAADKSTFSSLGTNPSGNEVWVNTELLHCDLKILTGFIEPHFFMGFSGGGKAIMPGMGYIDTIRFNHSTKMLSHSKANWGVTEGNPLWEDVHHSADKLDGIFLLNVTMNKKKEITGVFAGNLRKAHRLGCQFALRSSMVETKGPYDLVITSNSGYPLDLNIYQSVKGICAAAQIVKPGGTILMASECGDGIPRGSDYDKILQQVEDPGQLGAFLSRQELKYGDTWQVYMQALVQQKVKVGFYSDRLTPSTIRQALFEPVQNLDEAIREIVREAGSDIKICILPEGPQTIPYLPLS